MTILRESRGVQLSRSDKPLGPQTRSGTVRRDFDPKKFLATIGQGRKVVVFPRKQTIFTQGNSADAVFYIQQGKAKCYGKCKATFSEEILRLDSTGSNSSPPTQSNATSTPTPLVN
jgi:hypothetical protein